MAAYGLSPVLACFVAGCTESNQRQLIGCWWNEVHADTDVTTFCFDGSGVWSSSGPDESPMNGSYEVAGDTLIWHFEDAVFHCALHWRDNNHLRFVLEVPEQPALEFVWERRSR
mgnify:FL=1